MKKDDLQVPFGMIDLRSLLEAVDREIELLALLEQGVALSQKDVGMIAHRLDLQHQSLQHMLKDLQTLVRGLHALAARRETETPIQ